MVLGLGISTSAFTLIHVALSLIGIATGFVVVAGMFGSNRLTGWTGVFFSTTILTSATGFFFSHDQILPSHIVGALSLVVLAIALFAFYRYRLEASWRWIYVITALTALYFNVFVGVVQAFQKVDFLHALVSTQSDAPFVIAQVAVFVAFVVIAVIALRSFHPAAHAADLRPSRALN